MSDVNGQGLGPGVREADVTHGAFMTDVGVGDLDGPWREVVRRRIGESIDAKRRLLEDDGRVGVIVAMAGAVANAVQNGNKVLLFGNGGSAADSQHIAAELVGRYLLERRALPAVALADCGAAVTAIANDYGYEEVFSRQLTGLAAPGDVAIGISTSGSSTNVIRAIETARAMGLVTMVLTGDRASPLATISDYCIRLPTTDTPRVQECYMLVAHTICELVELAVNEQRSQ